MNFGNELLEVMKDFKYGYIDCNGRVYDVVDDKFSSRYLLQSPDDLLKNKVGICWDLVEFERNFFEKNNIKVETYFMAYYDNNNNPSHTFLVYEEGGKFIWFEFSMIRFRGIHVFNSKEELFQDVIRKFRRVNDLDSIVYKNLCLYNYEKPECGLNGVDFYKHCEKSEMISVFITD